VQLIHDTKEWRTENQSGFLERLAQEKEAKGKITGENSP
jgi:hypothetical protein